MATTLRLPPQVHVDARRTAAALGISVNALVAVALREFMLARPGLTPDMGGNQPKLSRAERRAAAKKSKRKGR